MSSTTITHFCGDPYLTLFWTRMYKKYWLGETSSFRALIAFNSEYVNSEIINIQLEALNSIPNSTIIEQYGPMIPEVSNPLMIKDTTEDVCFLIETDGYVFGSRFVSNMINDVENNQCDVYASKYALIDYRNAPNGHVGFMRNVFVCKTNILHQTDLNFLPVRVEAGTVTNGHTFTHSQDFDCFGWMSYQIATLTNNIKKIGNVNCLEENEMYRPQPKYKQFPYMHIRQMNSSNLGFTTPTFKKLRDADPEEISNLRIATNNISGKWQWEKACAFRLLFIEVIGVDGVLNSFSKDYKDVIERTIQYLEIDRDKIEFMKNYYKGILNP